MTLTAARHVLIVGHGPERGRDRGNYDELLDVVRVRHPRVAQRLVCWETGSPPPSLEQTSGVLFLLADPLRELYPECFAEATAIAADARERGIAVINPPPALSNTLKSRQAEIWQAAGIPAPRTRRYGDRDELLVAADAIGFPVILRTDHLHANGGTHVCLDRRELDAALASGLEYPGAVSELIDTRDGYRAGPLATFHHKRRSFVFGDTVRTHHLILSERRVVDVAGSLFQHAHRAGETSIRARLARRSAWRAALREDWQFFAHPEPQAAVVRDAVHALGLGFAGVDYCARPDGSLVLFEANPFFRFPTGVHGRTAGPRRLAQRVPVYADSFASFLGTLLD